MSSKPLPSNVRVSSSSAFAEKLAILRDRSLSSKQVRLLVAEMSTILSSEVIPSIESGSKIALVVILRSGMAMSDPFANQLPDDINIVIYHLGLFREKKTLEPVEYYNKLPIKDPKIKKAYIVDPLIATGGTAEAAIGILKDWGAEHITFLSLLASRPGLERVAEFWREGTDVLVGAVDETLDAHSYLVPGVGDIGDRLFGTNLQ